MDTSQLTKVECRYMLERMCKYLYAIPESELKATMSRDKDDFKAFIHETARVCFDQLGDRYLAVREKVDLLASRTIKVEMHRAMGEILKIAQAMPADISGLQGFQEKIQLIATLYQDMKGKGKAPAAAIQFVQDTEAPALA